MHENRIDHSGRRPWTRRVALATLVVAGTISPPAGLFANNGLTMTSYGAASAGMGGATLAVGNAVMDLESNPANLARLKKGIFEAGAGIMFPSLRYEDSYMSPNQSLNYQNSVNSEKAAFPLPYIGYVAPLDDHSGWGIAFYAQGGMGAEFNGIVRNTPGNVSLDTVASQAGGSSVTIPVMGSSNKLQENTYSKFALMKLTPGYAYRLGKLSLGLGADLNIATLEWRWTFSDPAGVHSMPAAGYDYKGKTATSFSGKVGLTYDIDDNWAVAWSYIAPAPMRFNGSMSANQYNAAYPYDFFRAKVSAKLTFAEQQFVGVAYKKNGLTIGVDIGYINWGSYMKTMNFILNMPWAPNPMLNNLGTQYLTFHTNFRDQAIYAVGLEYRPDKLAFRVGFNYGRSAVTSEGVNPLFPAVSDRHVMAGMGYRMDSMDIDFALEYALPKKVSTSMMSDWTVMHAFSGFDTAGMNNPYFGSSVTMRQIIPHLGVKAYF